MDRWKRSALLIVAAGPCLLRCAPDFDALSAGETSAGRSGDASRGGDQQRGGASGAPTGGQLPTIGGGGGSAPDTGGAGTTASAGGAGGDAPSTPDEVGGSGGERGCVTPHAGQLGYLDFDAGLAGEGFPDLKTNCSVQTLHGATCSEELDASQGTPCLGALQLSIAFKAYASGTAKDEIAFGDLDFSFTDWSQAKALHVMVKVSPPNAPINAIELYLQSGPGFLYKGIFDNDFKTGAWHELVFSLTNSGLDLTSIRRLGVKVVLSRADTAGIPTEPPAIDLLLDDVWLEPR